LGTDEKKVNWAGVVSWKKEEEGGFGNNPSNNNHHNSGAWRVTSFICWDEVVFELKSWNKESNSVVIGESNKEMGSRRVLNEGIAWKIRNSTKVLK